MSKVPHEFTPGEIWQSSRVCIFCGVKDTWVGVTGDPYHCPERAKANAQKEESKGDLLLSDYVAMTAERDALKADLARMRESAFRAIDLIHADLPFAARDTLRAVLARLKERDT